MSRKRFAFAALLLVLMAGFDWYDKKFDLVGAALTDIALLLVALFITYLYSKGNHRQEGCAEQNENWKLDLSLRRVVCTFTAIFFPYSGGCYRCYVPWALVRPHFTTVPEMNGERDTKVFALCEHCWNELADKSPECRLRYYSHVFGDWVVEGMSHRDWEQFKAAVLREDVVEYMPVKDWDKIA